jgi:hypothetical protein
LRDTTRGCGADSRFKVQGSRFKVQGSRFKVQGSRFKVGAGSDSRVPVLNFEPGTWNPEH